MLDGPTGEIIAMPGALVFDTPHLITTSASEPSFLYIYISVRHHIYISLIRTITYAYCHEGFLIAC